MFFKRAIIGNPIPNSKQIFFSYLGPPRKKIVFLLKMASIKHIKGKKFFFQNKSVENEFL